MENDEILDELKRLRAENTGLRLKVQDLETLLGRVKKNFDQLYALHKDLSGMHNRALSLLESYAELPGSNLLGKLDRKLGVYFPNIAERVKSMRGRKNSVKVTVVDGSLLDRPPNPDLDIRRLY
jgi:hypothetical protein